METSDDVVSSWLLALSRYLTLLEFLRQSWPPDKWRDVIVVIAVSGGADSVSLLHAMRQLQPRQAHLQVAHFNHGLRGEAAEADANLVSQLAANLGLAFHLGRGDATALAAKEGDGIESAARAERYAFLIETAEKVGARFVVTAHTADDQVETVLHRILRGTGVGGLAGIPRIRPLTEMITLIRPLLELRRSDILAYVDQAGVPFREDLTNRDEQFTRNRLRHSLLPQLRENYNPGVDEALLRLAEQAGECRQLIDVLLQRMMSAVRVSTTEGESRAAVLLSTLRDEPSYLVREFFVRLWTSQGWPRQGMAAVHWVRLAAMVEQADTVLTFPGEITARKSGDELVIRRRLN